MDEPSDTQLKDGEALIICCPLCGNGLTDPETKGNLKLNKRHKCASCEKGFSVRAEQ